MTLSEQEDDVSVSDPFNPWVFLPALCYVVILALFRYELRRKP